MESSKKHFHHLQQKKRRQQERAFLVEGEKGVREAIAAVPERIVCIGLDRTADVTTLRRTAEAHAIPIVELDPRDASYVSSAETFSGVIAIVRMSEPDTLNMEAPVLVLDGIRDPGNLGTIIRSADWFGISQVVLSADCVDVYNPKVVRSTMGSLFRLSVHERDDLSAWLASARAAGKRIAGLTLHGEPIEQLSEHKPHILVLGSESHGISRPVEDLLTVRYTIAGFGGAESLNAAVACGIALYHLSKI